MKFFPSFRMIRDLLSGKLYIYNIYIIFASVERRNLSLTLSCPETGNYLLTHPAGFHR